MRRITSTRSSTKRSVTKMIACPPTKFAKLSNAFSLAYNVVGQDHASTCWTLGVTCVNGIAPETTTVSPAAAV